MAQPVENTAGRRRTAEPDRPRTRRQRLVVALGAAYLVIQALFPIAPTIGRITDDDNRSRQFGWQMFSVDAAPLRWEVVLDEGHAQWFTLDVAYYRRADVGYEPHMSEWLCEHVDGARLVRRHRIPPDVDHSDRASFTLLEVTRCEGEP